MKRGKRKVEHILVGAAIAVLAAAWMMSGIKLDTGMDDWRDGDLIVQQSASVPILPLFGDPQGIPVHIGVVQLGPQGPTVLHALDTVVETPLAEFLANGTTRDYAVYRVTALDETRAASVLAAARAHLGRPGDFFLDETPERIYSSELVRLAFASAGISLGRTDRLRTLAAGNVKVRTSFTARWVQNRTCARRYLDVDACWHTVGNQEVAPPQWIIDDPQVTKVYATAHLPGTVLASIRENLADDATAAPPGPPPALRP